MSFATHFERWIWFAGSLALALALSGCADVSRGRDGNGGSGGGGGGSGGSGGGISLQHIAREEPRGGPGYVQLDTGDGAVRVYRRGHALDVRRGMRLLPGDEIQTNGSSAAVIRDPEHGEVVLASNTRVRLGSLEVLFGRVFADVRGFFTTSSENVVAGVEGTRFLFEVARDRSVRVAVLDGVVTCRSKRRSWAPIPLGRRQELVSAYPNRAPPQVGLTNPREMDAIRAWAEQVRTAPRAGYCCDNGRVYGATSNQCRGQFRTTLDEARQACEAFRQGWCCAHGSVTQTTQGRCTGSFYLDRRDAERACVRRPPPPEPMVWCCVSGNVSYVRRDHCGGRYFDDQASATKACQPAIIRRERIQGGEVLKQPQPDAPQIK